MYDNMLKRQTINDLFAKDSKNQQVHDEPRKSHPIVKKIKPS